MKRSVLTLVLGLSLAGCGARTIEDGFADEATNDAAVGSDTGFVPGADATPIVDTGIIVDTAPPPPGRPIACGMSSCDSAKQECCIESMASPPRCTAIGTCRGATFACTSSAGCARGESCCFNQDEGRAVCKDECEGVGPDGEVTLCTTNAECPPRTRCRRVGPGLNACVPG